MGRGLLLRFAAGALVGVVAAVAVGAAFSKPFVSTAPTGDPVSLVDESGAPVDFGLVKANNPQPLPAPPALETFVQLTAFHEAGPSAAPGGGVTQPWWGSSVPRIQAISQFDGGPLAKVNCLMAAAAMLARLGYGIVTTGSQLRALSGDTDFGTTYSQAQDAVDRGWGVRFFQGALTPLQLRAVLWAGAGAIIDGVYGKFPVEWRYQKNFTGRHAIYVDAFRPDGPNGQFAAYYLMDPIGRTWAGYKGQWIPAEFVDRFAMDLPGGRVATMWAFPGGGVPANRAVLPPEAYPSADPSSTPGASGTPGPSESPIVDPYPGELDEDLPEEPDGEDTGFEPPDPGEVVIVDGYAEVYPGFEKCAVDKTRFGCPRGIVGIVDLGGLSPPATLPPSKLDILYGSSIGPGIYQIIFVPPEDSSPELWFWSDAAGSKLVEATVEEARLGEQVVAVGTVYLDPALDYQFVATAEGDGVRSISSVGSLEVKQ